MSKAYKTANVMTSSFHIGLTKRAVTARCISKRLTIDDKIECKVRRAFFVQVLFSQNAMNDKIFTVSHEAELNHNRQTVTWAGRHVQW